MTGINSAGINFTSAPISIVRVEAAYQRLAKK
jgi:hypothetical protein